MTGRARIGIAAAVALLLTSLGLLRLLASGSWVWPIVLAVVVSTAAGELFRRLIRPRPLVVAAQAAVVFWYVMVLLAHDEAFGGVLPTWAVFHQLGDLYSAGAHDIRNTFVGGQATPGIAAILVMSLSALAVLVDALAATYGAAPLAGLPLLALYLVPATRTGGGYDWLAFALAAAGYTALLSAEGRDRLGRWGRPLVHAGIRRTGADGKPNAASRAKVDTGPIAATGHQITTFALIAAVLAPVLLPTVSGGLFGIGPNSGDGPGSGHGKHKSTFSQVVDLHASLSSTSDEAVLDYTASKPLYVRLQTADIFNANTKGLAFTPDPTVKPEPINGDGIVAASVPGYPASAPTPKTIKVDISYLSDTNGTEVKKDSGINSLPLPYPAKQLVNPPAGFSVNPESLAVLGPGQVFKGMKYTAEVYDVSQDSVPASVLHDAKLPTPADVQQFDLTKDLYAVGIPAKVSELAKSLALGKTNPVDEAMALQDYFQKSGKFSYSLDVQELNGAGAMTWLLDNHKGFCQTYALTMVAMARSLGIPARVALGFTPGELTKVSNTYQVKNHDYHAWPELFFDGVGWLRFEPTVGIENPGISGGHGRVPTYNTASATASSSQSPSASSSAPNGGTSSSVFCPIQVRKAGGCDDTSDGSALAGPKQKFSWLGWFGAVPRFLQYWLFGGSGYAIALRIIVLVLLLLACVPMVMRIIRRRARGKLASGRRSGRDGRAGRRGANGGAEDDEGLEWESADLPSSRRPESDPERQRILAAWAEVRDSATDLGYSWPASETPRQSARRIIKQAHLSHSAQDAMDRVTVLAERANYARTLRRPTANGAAPTPNLLADLKEIRAGLAEPVSRRTRIRATVLPPSALAALRERREDLTGRVYERVQGTGALLRSRAPGGSGSGDGAGSRPEGRESGSGRRRPGPGGRR